MPTELKPLMQKGAMPPFYELAPLGFQELCRDLVGAQGPFANCRVYGDNGQAQHGIDVRCDRKTGILEVAQSKCYRSFTPGDIKKASDEFIKYLDYWQKEGVKKFFLIVACRVSSIQANNQITLETKKFKEFGIEYELWDAVRIRDILRDHNKLIFTHLANPDYWLQEIGGDLYTSRFSVKPGSRVTQINEMMVTAFNKLSSRINAKTSQELEEKRELWREGDGESVIRWIKNIKNEDEEWSSLSPEIQANILCLEAAINIDAWGDYKKAEQYLDEARDIEPSSFNFRVRAFLELHKHGPQAGLDVLGTADDLDSLCVRASLLINAGRFIDAINLLETIQTSGKAEIHRLLALAYLNLKKIERAKQEIETAVSIAPKWESIRIVDGMVSYFSALSPAILEHMIFIWPIPVELEFTKTTEQAVTDLEKATRIFEKLAQNPYRSEQDRLSLEIWHAACLACDFRNQERAKLSFENLLLKYPTDHRLISWAVMRGYSTTLKKSRSELKKLIQKGLAKTEHIISTVMLDIHFKHYRNMPYIMEQNKRIFTEARDEFLWEFWYVQALLASKKLSDARKKVEETRFSTIIESLTVALLHEESKASGNYHPYKDYLRQGYLDGKHPIYLWELCSYYAYKSEWQNISPFAENLVSEIQTTESLRLSSMALYKGGKYSECRAFIEQHRSLCLHGVLPENLHLIYIMSKAFSGDFTEALSELRWLTEHNPSRQNIIMLRDFYLQKGDQTGLREVTRLVQRNDNILPSDIISIAESMLWVSRDLAKEMWMTAATEQLSSQKQIEKIMLGFALGLDHEMKDLGKHFSQIAENGQSFLRTVTNEDALKIFQEDQKQKSELFHLYSKGEIPIHVLAGNTGINLFAFYKNIVRDNSNLHTDVQHKFPIYVRYGGKTTSRDFEEPEPVPILDHLTLDTTSLILLDHFSILPILEAEIASFYLPNHTVVALVQMKDALLRYQSEIVRASKLISELLGERRIREIERRTAPRRTDVSEKDILEGFLQTLEQENGFVVGFWDNLNFWNLINPKNEKLHFATCADVIESMRSLGAITEEERAESLERLGTSNQVTENTLIPRRSKLFFMANTISLIAQTNILDQVCNTFEVWVESDEILRIRTAIKDERDRLNFADSLGALINNISVGIEHGKYIFLPPIEQRGKKQQHILFENLAISITGNQGKNSIPVVDDHNIQKYLHIHGAPHYGIFEILSWLRLRNAINDYQYYGFLSDFRRADLRYIPITKNEIIFHIKNANTENGELVETEGLKTLRSYMSACLVHGKKLQTPIQPYSTIELLGEMDFLFTFIHAVSYAISEIWQDNASDNIKILRSVWIVDNLFLDMLSLCKVIGWKRETKDHLFLVSLSLAELFLNGIQFHPKLGSVERKSYFGWIYQAVCKPMFDANPGLINKTADYIKTSILKIISEGTGIDQDKVKVMVASQLYDDLPEPIKEYINKDHVFLEKIGVQIITVVDVANIIFPAETFWNSLADVLSGIPTNIQAVSPEENIHLLTFDSKSAKGVRFTHPKTGQNINLETPDFAFLINQGYDNWIDENIGSFSEMSYRQLQDAVQQIAKKSTAAERFDLLDKLRKASIGNSYKVFEDDLVHNQTLVFEHLLPPSVISLLQYFCLNKISTKTKTADALMSASNRMVEKHGLVSAIIRFSSFPVELPEALQQKIKALSLQEREAVFSELIENLVTPISRIHLIRILGEWSDNEEKLSGLLDSFANAAAREEFAAFSSLLSWITKSLDRLEGIEKIDNRTKLLIAWGHSNLLFLIAKKSSVPFDWLRNTIRANQFSSFDKTALFKKSKLQNDLAHGENLDFLAFKILGFGYVLRDQRLTNALQQHLLAEVFPYEENPLLPAFELLRNRKIFTDSLDSFLARELSEALHYCIPDIENERISILNSSAPEGLASLGISLLAEQKSVDWGWQLLLGIFPNQIIPENLEQQFENSICNFSFADLANSQGYLGFLALHFTARQPFLAETSRSHLKQEILRLAEIGPDLFDETTDSKNQPFGKDEAISLLSEASIQLALAKAGNDFSNEFSALIRGIVARWTDARLHNFHFLLGLTRKLPIPIAQDLAEIFVELRAIK